MAISKLVRIVGLLLVAGFLPACDDSNNDNSAGNPNAGGPIAVELTGASLVTPVNTAATGSGTVQVDQETNAISGSVTVAGLNSALTGASIHTGFAGANGPVLVPLTQDPADPNRLEIPATTLTDEEMALLLAGGMYVNVQSAGSPDGEIRGQIVPEGIVVVNTPMSGEFEVPPVQTSGNGTGHLTLDTASGNVIANVNTSNLPSADQAHIHQAFAGLTGGVIVPLTQNTTTPELWEGTATLSSEQVAALNRGELYFNVHTPANPEGEIRGQIAPADIVVVRTTLDGSQEVPPVTTDATGIGYSTVNTASGDVAANIRTSGIVNETAAHIHQAPAGENGPVIVPLAQPDAAGTPELWTATSVFTPEQLAAYLANQTYFNVHTQANPDGEIRGQIQVPAQPTP